ncbi:hypothetical protein DSO57_1022935 [Entomophthora muscae]|uniref:Uncharacterized protein n=1 Tax=Entomophthora muscae TaxID=34485 RepID=A0ACC2UNV3_9FUNG|nr:hypothetical protein DSO57_1022935 [Entomophthora muscae]
MSGETNSLLYGAQNLFYYGSYQAAINECSNIQPQLKGQDLFDLKFLLYRSYIGLKKYNLVLGETEKQDTPELKGIYLFAKASATKASDLEAKTKIVDELFELAKDGSNILNVNLQILSSIAGFSVDKLEPALKAVSLQPKHLECVAIKVQILLHLDRVDLAQKELTAAKSWADDVPLIQLIEAWIGLRLGGQKFQEADAIFDELSQQSFAKTVKLLNCRAVANMHLGQIQEAEEFLQEALNKDGDDPETLANLIVCSTLNNKPSDIRERYVSQLREVEPHHPYLESFDSKSLLFEECASKIKAN